MSERERERERERDREREEERGGGHRLGRNIGSRTETALLFLFSQRNVESRTMHGK